MTGAIGALGLGLAHVSSLATGEWHGFRTRLLENDHFRHQDDTFHPLTPLYRAATIHSNRSAIAWLNVRGEVP